MKDEIDEVLKQLDIDFHKFYDGPWDYNGKTPREKAKQSILSLKKKWETEAYRKGYIQAGIDNLTNGDK